MEKQTPVPFHTDVLSAITAMFASPNATPVDRFQILVERDLLVAPDAAARLGIDLIATVEPLIWNPEKAPSLEKDGLIDDAQLRAVNRGASSVELIDLAEASLARLAGLPPAPRSDFKSDASGFSGESSIAATEATPQTDPDNHTPTPWIPVKDSVDDQAGTEIRIFISSTFRDMGDERDELAKRVLPMVRSAAEERGVTVTDVDLRWGITDEQKAEGQVLPICLEEIDECRPYFLGILGERYGWIPENIPDEVVERESWLADSTDRSVTEIEISHGVLNDPDHARQARFYFRDPSYSEGRSEGDFLEAPTQSEIDRLGAEKAQERADSRKVRLRELKKRIRASGIPVHENYAHPHDLGDLALSDLLGILDDIYPIGEPASSLDRSRSAHEAIRRSLEATWIGRAQYRDFLDMHSGGGTVVLVTGAIGSGKSALVANWIDHVRSTSPETLVIAHFVGANGGERELTDLLRRLVDEIAHQSNLAVEESTELETLKTGFSDVIHRAAALRPLVIVVDGLDRFENYIGAQELTWIPSSLPENSTVIVSASTGFDTDTIRKHSGQVLTIEPLLPEERRRLVVDYLATRKKALAPDLVDRIASSPSSATPLHLRVLLDELCVWGEHETLSDRIDHYLNANNLDDLYNLVLERFEQDYDRDRPHMTRDTLALLAVSDEGLSESELRDLLGDGLSPLPRASWEPLYLALRSSIVTRDGLLGYAQDHFRSAVRTRYLSSEIEVRAAQLKLAEYFQARDHHSLRTIAELPLLLWRLKDWDALASLLSEPEFFSAAWEYDAYLVRSFWIQLEGQSRHRIVQAFQGVLANPADSEDGIVVVIAGLLRQSGYPHEALTLDTSLVQRASDGRDEVALGKALGDRAETLLALGSLDQALADAQEQEDLYSQRNDREGKEGVARSATMQGILRKRLGRLDEALEDHIRAESIARDIGDRAMIQACLGNRALIHKARHEYAEAKDLLKKQEEMCRDIGQLDGLQNALGNLANIAYNENEYHKALHLHDEEERVCRALSDRSGLATCLSNKSGSQRSLYNVAGARASLAEAIAIYREIEDPDGLVRSLANTAALLLSTGQASEGLTAAEEAYSIATRSEDPDLAQSILPLLEALRARA
jgi:tetratricopeptide (TPR) repeat protein